MPSIPSIVVRIRRNPFIHNRNVQVIAGVVLCVYTGYSRLKRNPIKCEAYD